MIKRMLILILLLPISSYAQINKCVVNGKIIFTDKECPANTAQKFELKSPNNTPLKSTTSDLNAASPQSLTEQSASKETYIEGLRLLSSLSGSLHLVKNGISLGYVEKDENPGGGKYFCGALSKNKSSRAGKIINDTLSVFTNSSIKTLNLKYLILCSDTKSGGRAIGGIPVPPLNLIMLSVGNNENSPAYLKHTFLHELYHFIEYRFGSNKDPDWQKLFAKGYTNSYHGKMKNSVIGSAKKGFLNVYSTSFPHEERAELFATLLLKPAEVVAHIKASNDEILKDKVKYVVDKCERLLGLDIKITGML